MMAHAFHQLDRFLKANAFFPMLLSSVLAIGLLTARLFHSGDPNYIFLVWNLALAWIPYMSSIGVAALQRCFPKQWWLLPLPSALWLLFFPNAPYIVTDFWHLQERDLL